MNKLIAILTLCAVIGSTPPANAKKEKNEKVIEVAKIWFKDGSVYEGPVVKHWQTYRQSFTGSGHNFHTLPDHNAKSVKHESKDTDSILIVNSTHPDFKNGTMYVSFTGKVPMNGPRITNKMLQCTVRGRNVDMCKMPFVGNCAIGMRNMDDWMEYWLIRFKKSGHAAVFFEYPTQKVCHKPDERIEYFCDQIKEYNPGLAEAITVKFAPDKKTRKEMKKTLTEHPEIFLEFIDQYLNEHPE